MSGSNINCRLITKIDCGFTDDNRLCPDDCKGFVGDKEIKIDIVEDTEQTKRRK
jgi:hypothetical protein